jgi:hypothetical protein
LEIYHEWTCEGATQSELAARFNLSQSRITRVCSQVKEWVDSVLPESAACMDAGWRLHMAILLRRGRLSSVYDPLLEPFGGFEGWQELCRQREAAQAGKLTKEEARRLPPRGLLILAGTIMAELDELRLLAERGPLAGALERIPKSSWSEAGVPAAETKLTPAEQESSALTSALCEAASI